MFESDSTTQVHLEGRFRGDWAILRLLQVCSGAEWGDKCREITHPTNRCKTETWSEGTRRGQDEGCGEHQTKGGASTERQEKTAGNWSGMQSFLDWQLILYFSGSLTHHFGLSALRKMRRCMERGWGGSLEKPTGTPGAKDLMGFNLNLCGDCCDKLVVLYTTDYLYLRLASTLI